MSSITARELAFAASTGTFTRHFRHLLPVPRFLVRGPFAPGQPRPKVVKPQDRIKFWNIVPGDFVKLRGDVDGTMHEVHKVNKLSNRVILKREIDRPGFIADPRRPVGLSVPYSQCQVLIGKYEYPPEGDSTEPVLKNVFASRLTMSKPRWHSGAGHWIWERFAVNTVPKLPESSADTEVSVRVAWPTLNPVTKPEPSAYDTTKDAVLKLTYQRPSIPPLLHAIPRVPSEQDYINSLKGKGASFSPVAPFEVHLYKELSNPHSRAKKQARWQASNSRRKELLEDYIYAENAKLGGRTPKVADADATWKWQQRLEDDRRAELKRRWRNRGAEARLQRKGQRKARKAEKRDEKLRSLVLEEAKNQILPRAA